MNREKLVRSGIPEIIRLENGRRPPFRIAPESEMPTLLLKKLREEIIEFSDAIETGSIDEIVDELADVGQVLLDAGIELPLSSRAAETRRIEKLHEKGGFAPGIVMEISELRS